MELAYLFLSKVPAAPNIYPLSLHDALPILSVPARAPTVLGWGRSSGGRELLPKPHQCGAEWHPGQGMQVPQGSLAPIDRKSTRLNSSHMSISYAVFCLKKKKLIRIENQHVR